MYAFAYWHRKHHCPLQFHSSFCVIGSSLRSDSPARSLMNSPLCTLAFNRAIPSVLTACALQKGHSTASFVFATSIAITGIAVAQPSIVDLTDALFICYAKRGWGSDSKRVFRIRLSSWDSRHIMMTSHWSRLFQKKVSSTSGGLDISSLARHYTLRKMSVPRCGI